MDNIDAEEVQAKVDEIVTLVADDVSEDEIEEVKRELADLVQVHVFKMVGAFESEKDKQALQMLGGENYSVQDAGSSIVITIEPPSGDSIEVRVTDYSFEDE